MLMLLGDLAQLTAGFDPVFARADAEVEEIRAEIETLHGHVEANSEDGSETVTS